MGEEIKGMGRSYEISRQAFSLEEDAISELMETQQGYTIFRLKEKRPSFIPDFEAVKKDAEDRVKEKRARALAKEKAEECLKKLKAGEDFKKNAADFQVEIRTPEPFNRDGYLKQVDYSREFGKICFGLKEDESGGIAETQQGFYIFKLIERLTPDTKKFEEAKEELKKKLLQEKAYYLYEEWYDHLNKEAKVKTYL